MLGKISATQTTGREAVAIDDQWERRPNGRARVLYWVPDGAIQRGI